MSGGVSPGAPPAGRQLALAGLQLAGLWAFAVVQPLFDVLRDSPDFFVARGNGTADILIFALGIALLPPLIALGIEWLVGLISTRARQALHLCLVAVLVAMIVLGAIAEQQLPAAVLVAIAIAVGIAVAVAYAATGFVPSLLSVLGLAPLLFLGLFLLASPVSKLVLPQEGAAASSVSIPSSAPVVVLVLDEIPTSSLLNANGRIDRSRFPNFARLAGSSTWYRNATSPADVTTQAVPSILTGSPPETGSLPIASDLPENLFTLLGGSYRLAVHEAATELCPEDLCDAREDEPLTQRLRDLGSDLSIVSGHLLLPDSLASDLPSVTETFANFGAGEGGEPSPAEARRAIESEVRERRRAAAGGRAAPLKSMIAEIDGQGRALYFAHVELPHVPWFYLPDGGRYREPVEDPFEFAREEADSWPGDRWVARLGFQRHMLQLGYTDRLLGRLMDRLRAAGIWDRSLLAVVADHGSSFLPGQYRRVATERNLSTIAGVPMFVKEPGQRRGRIEDGPARTTDLLPTIADALDVELPFPTQGSPLPEAAALDRGPVSVHNRFDQRITQPLGQMVRARSRIVRRQAREFGAGAGWAALYRAGPDSAVIGRSVPPGLPPAAGGALELDPASSRLLDYSAGDKLVPALLSGTVNGVEPEENVAVAAGGRIAAIGRTYSTGGDTQFVVLLPPSAYRGGLGPLRLLRILPGGAGFEELGRTGPAVGSTG